jgi:hypothetical protein
MAIDISSFSFRKVPQASKARHGPVGPEYPLALYRANHYVSFFKGQILFIRYFFE